MIKNILLPVDLNHPESSTKALAHALDMSKNHDATIHVLTVIPDYGSAWVGSFFPADFSKKAAAETQVALAKYIADNFPPDVKTRAHVLHGTIYKEITAAADSIKADMIVMASHRPEMKDYFLGPNAARVVRHAKQSVLVVR